MIVGTRSGSRYEVRENTITRVQPDPEYRLRRDGEPLQVQTWVQPPQIGYPMIVALEPLFEGDAGCIPMTTLRVTTEVAWIDHRKKEVR